MEDVKTSTQIAIISKKIDDLTDTTKEQFDELTGRLHGVEGKLHGLETRMDNQFAELRKDIKNFIAPFRNLETRVARIEHKIA